MRRSSAASVTSATSSGSRSSLGVAAFGGNAAASARRRSSARVDPSLTKSLTRKPNNMWSNTVGESVGLLPVRNYIGPLLLCTLSPIFVTVLCHVLVHNDGSLLLYWNELRGEGVISGFYASWPSWRNLFVWKMIAVFMITQLLIMKLVPGKTYRGPVTPAGNVPVYRANGFQAFALSVFLYNTGVFLGLFKGSILYDHIGEILSSMNVFALLFCLGLYLKGLYAPSSSDHGSSGSPIFDFYWGTELYPRILGWDVKQFTNCRCGMMFWALFVVSCAYKQYETFHFLSYGTAVNATLQLIYIAKFFWWETGYLSSMDIAHDRAGFYICWGVLAFLPCVYTSHSLFLAEHPDSLTIFSAMVFFVGGVASIWINYDCDRQRQLFRRTRGRCKIWGNDPYFIEAKYRTEAGETKTNLLLGSGWWGVARHFHYLPEIAAAACWTFPVCTRALLPYFYVPYLVLLLVDRAFRDDARCYSKYAKYWEQYCKRVPYMILPGVL